MRANTEVEIKLIAPQRPSSTIVGSFMGSLGLEVDWMKPRQLKDVYWDTPDYRIFQEGLALRIRYTAEEAIATLKSPVKCEKGLHIRREFEWPLSGEEVALIKYRRIWPLGLPTNAGLPSSVSSATLRRVLTLHTLRHEATIRGEGVFKALLAVDSTTFAYGSRRAKHYEVEIELKEGSETELRRVGNSLCDRFGLSPSVQSKFAIGMELMGRIPKVLKEGYGFNC